MEEIFVHICAITSRAEAIEVICENGVYFYKVYLEVTAKNLDLKAFNIVHEISVNDENSMAELGLLIAARSVSRFAISKRSRNSIIFEIEVDRSYPQALPEESGPYSAQADSFKVQNATTEKVKDFAISQYPRGNRMGYSLRTERYRYTAWFEIEFRKGEKATSKNFFQIKIKTTYKPIRIPIKYYSEKDVETHVTCDNCNLEFAVYGKFANCPDCSGLNAHPVFNKSLDAVKKRFIIYDNAKDDPELQEGLLADILSGGISAFDALGKALIKANPHIYPNNIRNLFQKLFILSKELQKAIKKSLSDLTSKDTYEFLLKMFQVRHLYAHNMGVVDEDFIKKIPILKSMKGKKYPLKKNEIEKIIEHIGILGETLIKIK